MEPFFCYEDQEHFRCFLQFLVGVDGFIEGAARNDRSMVGGHHDPVISRSLCQRTIVTTSAKHREDDLKKVTDAFADMGDFVGRKAGKGGQKLTETQ